MLRTAGICLLIGIPVLAINLALGARSPTVWLDEVCYSDPAIRLLTGNGWTSTCWFSQPSDQLFISNMPLHPLLLTVWLWLFGISPLAVRALGYVLAVGTVVVVCVSLRVMGQFQRPAWIALFSATAMSGYGFVYGYRSGRYDMTTAIVAAFTVDVAFGMRNGVTKRVALLLCGVFVTLSGLQLIPFFVALTLIGWICLGQRVIGWSAWVAGGIVLAAVGWIIFLQTQGLLDEFRHAVSAPSVGMRGLASRLREVIVGLTRDPSTLVLVPVFILGLVVGSAHRQDRKLAVAGLLSIIVIPIVVGATGKFSTYYSWMKFLPALACAALMLERQWNEPRYRRGRWLALACILAAGFGLPARLMVVGAEWNDRDYNRVDAYVASALRATDTVFCSPQVYYAVRSRVAKAFSGSYLRQLRTEEAGAVDVLIIPPWDKDGIFKKFGSEWTLVGTFPEKQNTDLRRLHKRGSLQELWTPARGYQFEIYRRADKVAPLR